MGNRLLTVDKPQVDENLSGFLIRMAELNDYDKLAWIFSVAGFKDLTSLLQNNSSNLNYVTRDKVSLEKLSILTDVKEEELWSLTYSNYDSIDANAPYLCSINQNEIHKEAMVVKRCKVCALCLKEYGYIKKIWSLAYYTVCIEHKVKLVDKCALCGKFISWNRTSLNNCKCGYGYSNEELSEASTSELIISELLYYKCGYSNKTNQKIWFDALDLFSLNKFLNLLFFLYNNEYVNKGYLVASTLRNDDIHEFIIKVNNLILNWPLSFSELIDSLLKVSPEKSFHQALSGLLHFLYKDQKYNKQFTFLRREIEEYMVIKWEFLNLNASSLRTVKSLLTRKNGDKYINASTIPTRYGLSTRRLRELIDKKVIDGKYKKGKGSYIYLVNLRSLIRYKQRNEIYLNQKDLKNIFSTSNEGIMSLCKYKVIEYMKDSRFYLFKKEEIHSFQSRLDSKVDFNYKKEGKLIKLSVVQSLLSTNQNNGLGKVIKLMLSDEIIPCSINNEDGIFKYNFYYDDILDFIEKNENLITIENTAQRLKLSKYAINQLINEGYLGEVIKKHVVRFVTANELLDFQNKVINLLDLSTIYNMDVWEMKRCLNKNGLVPIFGVTLKDKDKILYDYNSVKNKLNF
ncbi:TniQ family protein [Bacillus sp. FJAT-27445]|uniref:TniQ family protein n=1 Tax=Bacillus sp. FJAT-27445 TaxID=1679166 RepID=UPI0007431ECE|nr:TniQ family protein [Bacillus sp. FJAT-27445]